MKQVLVTGANKGIGFAVVEAILREQPDYNVILGSRSPERGQLARSDLLGVNETWSERLSVLELDVGNDDSVQAARATLLGNSPPLSGLVNNAGLASESLENILNVNVRGIHRICDAFAPTMDAASRIVNVTSAAGPNFVDQCDPARQSFFLDPDIQWAELEAFMTECGDLEASGWSSLGIGSSSRYGLSKACANSLTQYLAQCYPQLFINACTPGFIETDLGTDFLGGRTPAEAGMKSAAEGARVIMSLLFSEPEGTGYYYGSDCRRSPMDRYRAPGSPAYKGD